MHPKQFPAECWPHSLGHRYPPFSGRWHPWVGVLTAYSDFPENFQSWKVKMEILGKVKWKHTRQHTAPIASMDMDAHSVGMQNKFSDQMSKTEEFSLRRTREEYIGCVAEMFSWSKQGFSVVGQCGKRLRKHIPSGGHRATKAWGAGTSLGNSGGPSHEK